MDLYDSPLNKAHHFSRKADKFAEKRLFDDACEFHSKAIDQLIQALKVTDNATALESINLQRQYHRKKQDILKLRKIHYLATQERTRVEKEMSHDFKSSGSADGSSGNLQNAIYRTFEEADSLLEILGQRKETQTSPILMSSGSKRPKDDTVVIEELRVVNHQSLIRQLMQELEDREHQVAQLSARIEELESSCPETKSSDISPNVDAVDVSTNEASKDEELTVDLPPLELPKFTVD